MANRRPLIVNSSAQQIQELSDADGLIGNGTIPVGGIIMWSGSVASIPTGWALCDGGGSTPDLRNRFVVGASSGTGDTTYPGVSVDATGGSADATLVSHNHTATVTDTGHTHGGVLTSGGQHQTAPDASGGSSGSTNSATTGISVSISTEGSSATNANLPPYYALAFIMRTT